MNHRAKFDAVSFILGGEILNRTNTQTKNSDQYIHTMQRTRLACVDNKVYKEGNIQSPSTSLTTSLHVGY